jgi:hypothetical protein
MPGDHLHDRLIFVAAAISMTDQKRRPEDLSPKYLWFCSFDRRSPEVYFHARRRQGKGHG